VDEYGWIWLQQQVSVLECRQKGDLKRIIALEQQVANQAVSMREQKLDSVALKSQAARQQANSNLYAPLRSDTKPLLEMSAFVRKIAEDAETELYSSSAEGILYGLIREAQDILKRST